MANIYNLTRDLEYLQNLLLQAEPEDEDEILAALQIAAENLEDKAVGYAHIIRNLESDIAGLKAEEKRLADRRKRAENTVERLKSTLFEAMAQTGKTAFEKGNFSFKIARNGGALPVVIDVDPAEMPDELVTIERKPNKAAITTYINETGDISYAHFGERGMSLRIK